MIAGIPPALYERVVCSIGAAAKYGVPANIILAVAQREGGKPGQWVRNTNATYDVGPMQFNTSYVRTLARHGIGTNDVAKAGCFSYDLAAWRLRSHIKNDRGDIWTRVSNYHSRTPVYNQRYRAAIMVYARYWANWLSSRFSTYDTLTVAGSRTVAAVKTAPIAQAPVAVAKQAPNVAPVRITAQPTRDLLRASERAAELASRPSPATAPIRVAFTQPDYAPRSITVND